jgi:hypothetical protein
MKQLVEAIAKALVDSLTRFKSAQLKVSRLPCSSCASTRVTSGK